MSQADAAAAAFRAYVEARGLIYYEHWSIPDATQLLRHGFAQRARNLGLGELPNGLGHGWLAHAGYSTSRAGLEDHEFTVVLARVPGSIGFAVRVLCHDRGLSEAARSNPNADAEVIELEDRDLQVESVRFLERYAVATDHDQDKLVAWQLFSPGLIHWLTEEAPPRFSFELQDGALCCFVPGSVSSEHELDELCAAAGRLHARVLELAAANPAVAATAPTRASMVDAELAAHPFDAPPSSVFAAARGFGLWGLITGRSWRLGAEAFFRLYAAANGFTRIDDAEFRAAHIQTPFPGEVTQIASGRIAAAAAWLILTKDPGGGFGWIVLVADAPNPMYLFAAHGLPEIAQAEEGDTEVITDDRSIIVFKPDRGPRSRTRQRLDSVLNTARTVVEAAVAAAAEAERKRS